MYFVFVQDLFFFCWLLRAMMESMSYEDTATRPPTGVDIMEYAASVFNEFLGGDDGDDSDDDDDWVHHVVRDLRDLERRFGLTVSAATSPVRRMDIVSVDVQSSPDPDDVCVETTTTGLAVTLEGAPVLLLVPHAGVLHHVFLTPSVSHESVFSWYPLGGSSRRRPQRGESDGFVFRGFLSPGVDIDTTTGGMPVCVRLAAPLPPLDAPLSAVRDLGDVVESYAHFTVNRFMEGRIVILDVLLGNTLCLLAGAHLAATHTAARILDSLIAASPEQLFVHSVGSPSVFSLDDVAVLQTDPKTVELVLSTNHAPPGGSRVSVAVVRAEEGSSSGVRGAWSITWRDGLVSHDASDDDGVVLTESPPPPFPKFSGDEMWKNLFGTPLLAVWTPGVPSSFVDPPPGALLAKTVDPPSGTPAADLSLRVSTACVTFLLAWDPPVMSDSMDRFLPEVSTLSRPFIRDCRSFRLVSKLLVARSKDVGTPASPGGDDGIDLELSKVGPTWPTYGSISRLATAPLGMLDGVKDKAELARVVDRTHSTVALMASSPSVGAQGVSPDSPTSISSFDADPALPVCEFRLWCIPPELAGATTECFTSPETVGILTASGVWSTAMDYLESMAAATTTTRVAPTFAERRALSSIVRVALLHGSDGVSLRSLRDFVTARRGYFDLAFSPRRRGPGAIPDVVRLSSSSSEATDRGEDDAVQPPDASFLPFTVGDAVLEHSPACGFVTLSWRDDASAPPPAAASWLPSTVTVRIGADLDPLQVDMYDQFSSVSKLAYMRPLGGPATSVPGRVVLGDGVGWTAWSPRTAYRLNFGTVSTTGDAGAMTRVCRSAYKRGARPFSTLSDVLLKSELVDPATLFSSAVAAGRDMAELTATASDDSRVPSGGAWDPKSATDCATHVARALAAVFVDMDLVTPPTIMCLDMAVGSGGSRRPMGYKLGTLPIMSLISACRLVVAFSVTTDALKWWLVPMSDCPPSTDSSLDRHTQAPSPLFMFWGDNDPAGPPTIIDVSSSWAVPADVMAIADILAPVLENEESIAGIADLVASARTARSSKASRSLSDGIARRRRRRVATVPDGPPLPPLPQVWTWGDDDDGGGMPSNVDDDGAGVVPVTASQIGIAVASFLSGVCVKGEA